MNEIPWHDRVTTNENTDTAGTVEELYQAFKVRMIAELGVQTWHMDGPRKSGNLFDRAPTGDKAP